MSAPTIIPPTPVATQPSTLTVVTSTYLGEPTVRKSMGRVSTVYTGSEVVDRFITIGVTGTITIEEEMAMFVIQTASGLDVTIDGGVPIPVSYFLLTDQGNSTLSLTNKGAANVTVHLSYLTP